MVAIAFTFLRLTLGVFLAPDLALFDSDGTLSRFQANAIRQWAAQANGATLVKREGEDNRVTRAE